MSEQAYWDNSLMLKLLPDQDNRSWNVINLQVISLGRTSDGLLHHLKEDFNSVTEQVRP